ncbi:class I SAM-dependent methyltransferase [Mesobacillus zeae]|uniref:Class I SAM-dependent methyltransferase n=1 Tax=Mesobacillus zeae TaxID=1917180 RepID=A0A398B903_9BACI|nr:class I SAM-dependent methyltransferase [Mesobacillus zeae]RID84176.1 class I SAM-dependent methyltransferase [Mesobacillus zeae]
MGVFEWSIEAENKWNRMAESWNSRSREMWESGSRKDIVPFIKKHVPAGSKIADLGCGDGYGSFLLSQSGYHVTGMDVSEEMIQFASQRAGNEGPQFLKGDIANTGFPQSSFDALVAINCLEWTESPLAGLREMSRIVKDGGLAAIGILGPTAAPREHSFSRLLGEKVVCNTMMPWEFEKLALDAGWQKKSEIGVYKKASERLPLESIPLELKQAVSFMWVFLLQKGSV